MMEKYIISKLKNEFIFWKLFILSMCKLALGHGMGLDNYWTGIEYFQKTFMPAWSRS